MERPNYHKRRSVIGSGFFVYSDKPEIVLLFTAAHVLEDFEKVGFGWITVGTTIVDINDVGIREINPEQDWALWKIPAQYFVSKGVANIPTLPLFSEEDQDYLFFPTCSFAIIGYPYSKNSLIDMRDGGDRFRKLVGLALHGYRLEKATSEICFSYTGKAKPEAWSPNISTPPALDGMSGSPCLRFVIEKKQKRPTVLLAGIFTRWKDKREVRAVALPSPWLSE